MEPWEENLLESTREYVRRLLHHIPPNKRELVVLRIYKQMHRTLKLFHKRTKTK
jgi:hypothetical protein